MGNQLDQALHNVAYHPPKNPDTADTLGFIRGEFFELLNFLDPVLPDGREKAITFTHIEEACMYAIAAVVRNQTAVVETA